MAKAGLSTGFTTLVNPYSSAGPDLSIAAPDLPDMSSMQNAAASAAMMPDMSGLLPMVDVPERQSALKSMKSVVQYNPTTDEFAVGGQKFAADDATRILQSEQALGQPAPDVDLGSGWTPVTTESYQQIIAGIKDPSFGAMVGKGFEIGTQNLKTLYGSALQSVSGDEYGGGMVRSAEAELAKLQPYQRDVAEGITADWFATSIGQQFPMLLESIATGLAGAAAGSAAGGPGAGTLLGGLAGIFGKKAFKDKLLQAAAKYNAAKSAGVALNSSPELIEATKLLRKAGATVGAVAASSLGNEIIAAGDIYGEGGTPLESWVKGVPYAALDSLTDALFVGRILGGGRRALPSGATLGQRAVEYGVKRFGAGLAVGGLAEGTTETAQEAIVLEAGGKDLTSPEAINRYLNSFAAGAAVGGLMGGVANLRSRPNDETNLLDNTPPPAGTQYDLFPDIPDQAGPPRPPPGGGGGGAVVEPEISPDQMGFDFGPQQQDLFPLEVSTPYGTPQAEDRRAAGLAPPAVGPGQLSLLEPTQDVLPFFEPGPELQQRMQPVGLPAESVAPEVAAPIVTPAQGVLQFAPPAPDTRIGRIGQLLLQQRDYPLAQAQQEEQKAQDLPLAQAQQQLQLATNPVWTGQESTGLLPTLAVEEDISLASLNAARDAYNQNAAVDQQAQEAEAALLNLGVIGRPPVSIPPVQRRVTQPAQLLLPLEISDRPIFNQPRPTRAEKLKRGARPAPLIPEVVPATQKELETAGQLRLFDEEGNPTVAALKSAGLKRKRPKPKASTDKQRGATGFRGKTAKEKAAEEAQRKAAEEAAAKKKADEEAAAAAKKKADALKRGAAAKKRAAAEAAAKKKAEDEAAVAAAAKRAEEERLAREQEKEDALQEQGADEVSARGEPQTGEGVGRKVRRAKRPPGKGRSLKTQEEAAPESVPQEQAADQEAVTPEKKSEAALAAATEATPSAGEVTITVEVGEGEKRGGTPVNANELLAKVDSDIDRFKALLACLNT